MNVDEISSGKNNTEGINVLNEIDKTKLYRKLGEPSLFNYAVRVLGLSEAVV